MSGRDHETDHDGECFKNCRECELETLRILARAVKRYVEGDDTPEEWDIMVKGLELWELVWGKNDR